MSRPLRGILIGAGYFAAIQLEAWQAVRGARIDAVLSLTADNAQALAGRYRLAAYEDWDRALSEIKPDFVDICTPPDSHLHYAKLAADRGLPVLCQKPLAPSLEEAEELVRYCRDRSVPLMVNENWRWQGWYREIKRMIEAGLLGRVYTAYFAMRPGDGWGEAPYPQQPYFREMEKFLIYETGVHWIDTFRYLLGEIDSVYCQTRTVNDGIKGEDLAIIHFNFASGAVGLYDANRTTGVVHERSPTYGVMTLEGTAGKLRLDEQGAIYLARRGEPEVRHPYVIPDGWKGGGAIAAQQHFIDELRSGRMQFETSGTEYLGTVRIVYDCYHSAETNQVVIVKNR